jgi:hypothetical protein
VRGGALALLLLVLPASAFAADGPILVRAAHCLEQRPVCVDRGARRVLGDAQARALAREIADTRAGPMFMAVLPAGAIREAGGSATQILTLLHARLGRPGTYAVVVGPSFRAIATPGFPHAVPIAAAASSAHGGEGTAAVLANFVDRVADERKRAPGTGRDRGSGGGGSSSLPPVAIVVLAVLGVVAWLLRARRRRGGVQRRRSL